MSTRQITEVICDCPGGADCPDPIHDAGEPCEHGEMIRTNRRDLARLTAMTHHGYSVVPSPMKGTYVLGDRCCPCTDWVDVEARVRAGLCATGWATDMLDDILAKVRDTLARLDR